MRAAVLVAPNQITLRRPDDPIPAPGDMLVRVRAATICGTDIRIFRGKKTAGIRHPSVLGHEFSGGVIDAGGHDDLNVGDRVGLCPHLPCGACHSCKSGREKLCADGIAVGYEIDGAFAEIIRIPGRAAQAGNLRKLPDSMRYEEAARLDGASWQRHGHARRQSGNTAFAGFDRQAGPGAVIDGFAAPRPLANLRRGSSPDRAAPE